MMQWTGSQVKTPVIARHWNRLQVQEVTKELNGCVGAVEEERARRAAAARAYAEELEGLPLKPVSAWPAPVRTLVRQREAAAAEVCFRCGASHPASPTFTALQQHDRECVSLLMPFTLHPELNTYWACA